MLFIPDTRFARLALRTPAVHKQTAETERAAHAQFGGACAAVERRPILSLPFGRARSIG
ncbi:hypothetical protein [Sphingomonas quercus]|uniref:Uncharacterized protein n=1 Tax=Sphingomonas quercus TaxID=2842451 RepID=A0ABS6BH00_9SPHN|nr:hypothetical protein [Sphingomonas quercus]MBU3077578.1 hypothetical protein [Sphingomonas quercus]